MPPAAHAVTRGSPDRVNCFRQFAPTLTAYRLMPAITGFHHTALHSGGFDASVSFYVDVLGLTERIAWGEAPNRAVMLDAGGNCFIEIFEKPERAPADTAPILHFALRTDDCHGMLERVRAAGREVTMEPKDVLIDSSIGPVPVRIAFFKGPDGEIVELFENAIL